MTPCCYTSLLDRRPYQQRRADACDDRINIDGDRRRCLYDECSLASVRKTHVFWVNDYPFEPGGSVFKKVEEAKVWRDASPMERIEMQLRNAQMIRQMSSRPAAIDSCNEHIRELEKEKAELLAQAT